MKIWLPIKSHMTGGSSSFATKFKQGTEQHGHEVLLSLNPPSSYDILLVSPRTPLAHVFTARRAGKKIVHRLDGAYYPATPAGWLFPAYNAPLTAIQYLSHHTVYQSRYAQMICRRLVGPRSAQRSTIIYNGVDTRHFTPIGPHQKLRSTPDQHILFTVQQFRRHDQLEPLLQALAVYQQKYHQNAKLVIVGDFVSEAATLLPDLKNNPHLQLLGPIPNDHLPSYLRAADAFMYCHPNPACPNNILEAMACGVPIVGINDGAMTEIVRHEQDGYLVNLPGNGHIHARPFNPNAFAAAMQKTFKNKNRLGVSARHQAESTFNLQTMITHYVRLFEQVLTH